MNFYFYNERQRPAGGGKYRVREVGRCPWVTWAVPPHPPAQALRRGIPGRQTGRGPLQHVAPRTAARAQEGVDSSKGPAVHGTTGRSGSPTERESAGRRLRGPNKPNGPWSSFPPRRAAQGEGRLRPREPKSGRRGVSYHHESAKLGLGGWQLGPDAQRRHHEDAERGAPYPRWNVSAHEARGATPATARPTDRGRIWWEKKREKTAATRRVRGGASASEPWTVWHPDGTKATPDQCR
jgi:hypothetical protein